MSIVSLLLMLISLLGVCLLPYSPSIDDLPAHCALHHAASVDHLCACRMSAWDAHALPRHAPPPSWPPRVSFYQRIYRYLEELFYQSCLDIRTYLTNSSRSLCTVARFLTSLRRASCSWCITSPVTLSSEAFSCFVWLVCDVLSTFSAAV